MDKVLHYWINTDTYIQHLSAPRSSSDFSGDTSQTCLDWRNPAPTAGRHPRHHPSQVVRPLFALLAIGSPRATATAPRASQSRHEMSPRPAEPGRPGGTQPGAPARDPHQCRSGACLCSWDSAASFGGVYASPSLETPGHAPNRGVPSILGRTSSSVPLYLCPAIV